MRCKSGVLAMVAAMILAVGGFACAQPIEPSGREFSASIRELRADGRLIVRSGGEDFAILMSDYRLPKKGEPRFERLQSALRVASGLSLSCEIEDRKEADMYAVCRVEGRTLLSEVFAQWGLPDS